MAEAEEANIDYSEFECWNVVLDFGSGRGLNPLAFIRYEAAGPKYMLTSQVRNASEQWVLRWGGYGIALGRI
jgi:hypothetical protein